jgi:hypothetical protein
MWLFVAVGVLFSARFVLAAASRVLDLALTVVAITFIAAVVWRLGSDGRRDQRRP